MALALFWTAVALVLAGFFLWLRDAVVRAALRDLTNHAVGHKVPVGTTMEEVDAWRTEVCDWVRVGLGEHEAVRLMDYSGMTFWGGGGPADKQVRGFRNRLRELSDRMAELPVRITFPIRKYRRDT